MAWIVWAEWQRDHIERRHAVTREHFEEAWHDPARVDGDMKNHETHGPFYESLGNAADGRLLEMVWRWQDQDKTLDEVWPITAYFVED